MTITHTPVLLAEILRILDPQDGQVYLDGTAGYGGHASAIIPKLGRRGRAILVDRDASAVQYLSQQFEDTEIIHATYAEVAAKLHAEGESVDLILLDLGVSSPQLDVAERGFSFRQAAELDMRMDRSQALTADRVVNTYAQADLERVIREYGEERRAKAIAKAIVAARPIHTTTQLSSLVRRIIGNAGDIDPATRTFQALRIEVNDELSQLSEVLPYLEQILRPHGRLAVISFHSLEDRIVKQFIDQAGRDCICPPKQPICTCGHQASLRNLTPRPISGATHDATNPRARSAKLRAAEKINKNQ